MELGTAVDSRTKEPFSMEDQNSVTSSITYQATFGEQSNFDTSTNSTPKNSPKATVVRDLQSSKLDSVEYRSASRPELQLDPTDRSAANLTPATRSNNRGRSRSPRPVVTAEARARWAMLASLAGINKDENLAEDEEEGQRAPDATKQSSDPSSDPRLRPLHLLDPSGDAASIERYLHNLEKDPHVDNDLLQEGLQASKRLSNDYTKVQQATTRNRGQSSATEPQADCQGIRQEVHNQQMERMRPGEGGAEQGLQDRHSIARDEPSITASLSVDAQILEEKNRALGQGVEHGYENAKADIEGNISTTSRNAEAILHTLGDHDLAGGLEKGVHEVEGAVDSVGSELHVPNIRRDVGNAERDLSLAGKKTMRNIREDKHDVDVGFRDTERLIENKLSGLDIRHDIRKGEHDLNDNLHKLEGVDLARDVRKGEHELKNGLHKLEGADLNIRKGEHKLKDGLHNLEGADLDIRKDEHELKNGLHKLEGVDLVRDSRKGEHVLKEDMHKIEGAGLIRDVRRGEHDLDAGIRHAERTVKNAAPQPLMAQHGPVRPPTNPAQQRPSPAPAGLRAPYPTTNEPTRATMPAMPSEIHHLSPMGQAPTQRGLSDISHQTGSNNSTPNFRQAPSPNTNQSRQTSAQSRPGESAHAPRSNEINPRLSQPAVPPIGSNSFRPDQQRQGGNQSGNQVLQPLPARPQSDRYQALSTNRPTQPMQPGANQPAVSNVKVPTRMSSPSVDAANLGPQHQQETRAQNESNHQLGKETSPAQAAKSSQNPQGIRQSNLDHSGQHSKQQEPGNIAKSTAEDQRKAPIQGDGKAAAKLVQTPLSQTKAPQKKEHPSILPLHTPTKEDEPGFQRNGHGSNATTLQSQSNAAAKRLSQTTTHVPSPVSGPQQMLNMFKARSQASIDAAGGCPGFMDRKSPQSAIGYFMARSQS